MEETETLVGTNSLLYDEILLKNAKIKTMKAKEKATELINKFFDCIPHRYTSRKLAKKCALIAVDEILTQLKQDTTPHEPETINGKLIGVKYWQDVKKEL